MKSSKLMIIGMFAILASCADKKHNDPKDKPVEPVKPRYEVRFNTDSAYHYVQEQVNFGPRVPQTAPHDACAIYLEKKLNEFCDTAFVQFGSMDQGNGRNVPIKNIIGSFNPDQTKRVLLCAHWDTRPQADQDENDPTRPADGANDGASGVGVLLEVARQLAQQRPDAGVDIIFFDAEDMGESSGRAETWCLGSQYWAKNPHMQNYVARFGILLDMVGPPNAVFAIEAYSWHYAQPYVVDVWRTASALGYGNTFVNYQGGTLIDDHYFINTLAGIPTLDIIHYDARSGHGFGDFWHTHDDNMESIDKNTLNAVGKTVFKVVMDF